MGDTRQNGDLSFEELYEQARRSVPMVQELGEAILKDVRSHYRSLFDNAEFQNGPLKKQDRALAKINGDYDGDHHRISDLARGRLIVNTAEQAEELHEYLESRRTEIGIENYKYRFAEPSHTAFRDINTKIRLPNGHLVEFRVEHRDLMLPSRVTHPLYESVQEIERAMTTQGLELDEKTQERRQLFLDNIRDIHNAPARDVGLDSLLNDKGRAILERHEAERIAPPLSKATLADIFAEAAGSAPDKHARIAKILSDVAGKSGPVGGVVLGAGAAGAVYMTTGDAQAAMETAYGAAVPYGETQLDLLHGDVSAAAVSASIETASNGGALAGSAAGTAGGFMLAGPLGGVAGGLAGSVAGALGAGHAAEGIVTGAAAARFFESVPAVEDLPANAPRSLDHMARLKEIIVALDRHAAMLRESPPDFLDPAFTDYAETNNLLSDLHAEFGAQYQSYAEQGSLPEMQTAIDKMKRPVADNENRPGWGACAFPARAVAAPAF